MLMTAVAHFAAAPVIFMRAETLLCAAMVINNISKEPIA